MIERAQLWIERNCEIWFINKTNLHLKSVKIYEFIKWFHAKSSKCNSSYILRNFKVVLALFVVATVLQ